MASVSGAYLYCIWKLSLNEHQNDIRVWSVSELYLEGALIKYYNGIRVRSVSVLRPKLESE